MNQPVGYTVGNILFLAIGNTFENSAPSLKYMMVSWSTGIFTTEIYTVEEIKTRWPNVKQVDSLLNIKEIYNTP